MKYQFKVLISAALVALILVACKPTEANYKKAYDAALAKRQQVAEEQMRPASGLLSDDGPMRRVLDGDTVYVLAERLRTLDGNKLPGSWALAVGAYKMDTNAKASAEDLKADGYVNAQPAIGPGKKYYTILHTASSLDSVKAEAVKFVENYPHYPFVGLPGAPVLISY